MATEASKPSRISSLLRLCANAISRAAAPQAQALIPWAIQNQDNAWAGVGVDMAAMYPAQPKGNAAAAQSQAHVIFGTAEVRVI